MPLIKSSSPKAIGENIAIEKNAHPDMSNAQAAAIAYSTQRAAQGDSHADRQLQRSEHERNKYGK